MKTKRHWYIAACILLAIVIAVACICWAEKGNLHSETTNSTSTISISTTTTNAVTTLASDLRTTSTTLATTAITLPSTTHKKVAKTTVTQTPSPSQSSSSHCTTGSTHSSEDLSDKDYEGEYYDKSQLTFTQADVGKVVGYSPMFNRDIIVVRVEEKYKADGRRGVCIFLGYRGIEGGYWSPSGFCIVECKYCHEFPCPNGGKEQCPQYDVKLDATRTCQQCGLPKGNGYYGTCHGLIDWGNGGTVSCNHYSNCLKCGRPVGDGYNGTCHITWGIYPGVTTCNHYD